MFVLSMRSSSYGRYTGCEHAYFLEYVCNFKSPSGKKADLGNATHKALEILAMKKMYEQGDISEIFDDGIGKINPSDITIENALNLAFDYYVEIAPHNKFTPADRKTCLLWTNMACEYKNGVFNPLNRDIVSPEKKFSIEIKDPWAAYDFEIEGKKVNGNLVLQGTVDLITRLDNNSYEVIDWKTGSCVDFFNNFKKKDYNSFTKDPQLLIYYYALRNIYPEIENIIFTIVWIRDGGPFSLAFGHKDYLYAEKLIKDRFLSIKNNMTPQVNRGKHCSFCFFNKNNYKDSNLTYCDYFAKEIKKHGVDKTAEWHGDMRKLGKYLDGGGKKSNDG